MIPSSGTLRTLVLILCAPVLLAPRAQAQNADSATPALPRSPWAATPEPIEIARALRESRRADSAPASKLVDRIARAGPAAVEAQIEILVRNLVPETGPDESPQILSDPQRELLLAAVSRMRASAVRTAIQARLARDPDDVGTRLAAIHVFGEIGGAGELATLVDLAPRPSASDKVLLRGAREPLRSACGKILHRDSRGYSVLGELLRRTDASTASVLLEAAGSAQDPRALGVLYAATSVQRELGPQIAALASRCGASSDRAVNREFIQWLLSEMRTARPEYARSLLQALGTLDDGTNVPLMIERLSSKDAGVRDSALWALRRVSGLGFPADPAPWLVWIRGEVDWQANMRPRLRLDLASRDSKLIVAALRSYGEHRTRRAELAEEVAKVLADRRPEIRRLACGVLQTLAVSSSSGALTAALQDSDPGVAEAAWKALKTITGLDLPRDPKRVREILLNS